MIQVYRVVFAGEELGCGKLNKDDKVWIKTGVYDSCMKFY